MFTLGSCRAYPGDNLCGLPARNALAVKPFGANRLRFYVPVGVRGVLACNCA